MLKLLQLLSLSTISSRSVAIIVRLLEGFLVLFCFVLL